MSDQDDPLTKIGSAIAGAKEVTDQDPFTGSEDEFDGITPPDDPEVDWELVRRCAAEPQNDIGNARRLMIRHGADLLHLQRVGWHVWDGRRWAEDVDGRHSRPMAHRTVELILFEPYVIDPTEREQTLIDTGEAAAKRIGEAKGAEARSLQKAISDGETAMKAVQGRRAQRRRFANSSGNKGKLDGMLAELLPRVSRPVSDMDADGLALNVLNGTLRFVEVEEEDPECPDPDVVRMKKVWRVRIGPHRREDLITKLADVEYDPEARAPIFRAFLERVVPDLEVRAYLRRYFGYGLLGTSREQVFALLHGEGANGKSTLVDICCRIMGDYATSLPIATLIGDVSKRGSEATPDLARLPGARFVRTAEPKEGLPLNEDIIKTLTSSEPVPIRRLHQEFIDVYPVFNLVISANRKPDIRGDNDGIWRRVHLVPFEVQIPPEERDKGLGDKLWAERSGILNWLIGGAIDYLAAGGLAPPPTVVSATEEYRAENDVMGAFIRGALEITRDTRDQATPGELFQAFEAFCRNQAITPWRETTFAKRFAKAAERYGIEKAKISVTVYRGLRISTELTSPSRTHLTTTGG